jgi:hypothetical protein
MLITLPFLNSPLASRQRPSERACLHVLPGISCWVWKEGSCHQPSPVSTSRSAHLLSCMQTAREARAGFPRKSLDPPVYDADTQLHAPHRIRGRRPRIQAPHGQLSHSLDRSRLGGEWGSTQCLLVPARRNPRGGDAGDRRLRRRAVCTDAAATGVPRRSSPYGRRRPQPVGVAGCVRPDETAVTFRPRWGRPEGEDRFALSLFSCPLSFCDIPSYCAHCLRFQRST